MFSTSKLFLTFTILLICSRKSESYATNLPDSDTTTTVLPEGISSVSEISDTTEESNDDNIAANPSSASSPLTTSMASKEPDEEDEELTDLKLNSTTSLPTSPPSPPPSSSVTSSASASSSSSSEAVNTPTLQPREGVEDSEDRADSETGSETDTGVEKAIEKASSSSSTSLPVNDEEEEKPASDDASRVPKSKADIDSDEKNDENKKVNSHDQFKHNNSTINMSDNEDNFEPVFDEPKSDDDDFNFENFDDLNVENFTIPSFEINPIVDFYTQNDTFFLQQAENASRAAVLTPPGVQLGNLLYRIFQGPDRTKLPVDAKVEDIYRYLSSMMENETNIIGKEVMPYLMELGYKVNINGKCSQAMGNLANGLRAKRTWAYKCEYNDDN